MDVAGLWRHAGSRLSELPLKLRRDLQQAPRSELGHQPQRARLPCPLGLALQVFVPAALLALLVGAVLESMRREQLLTRLEAQQQVELELAQEAIVTTLAVAAKELGILARSRDLQGRLNPPGGRNGIEGAANPALAQQLLDFARASGTYQQIRWIDRQGRERLRVGSTGGGLQLLPVDRRSQAGEAWFERALALGSGQLALADRDRPAAGRNGGSRRPLLQLVTPLADLLGRQQGVLVVDFSFSRLFAQLREIDQLKTGGNLIVATADGQQRLDGPAALPALPAQIRQQPSGSALLGDGLWSWRLLTPAQVLNAQRRHGQRGGRDLALVEGPSRLLLVHLPAGQLAVARAEQTRPLRLSLALLLLALAPASCWTAQLRQRQRQILQDQRRLLDALPDPWWQLEPLQGPAGTIEDFRITDLNPPAAAMVGLEREQLIGTAVLELVPELRGSEVLQGLEQVSRQGQPWYRTDLPFTAPRLRGGQPGWYDLDVVQQGSGLLLVVCDVSERVRAAEQLAQAKARYQLLAENASDVVLEVDHHWRVRWASPAVSRVLGYDLQALDGMALTALVAPDPADQQQLRELQRQLQVHHWQGVVPLSRQLRWLTSSGDSRWMSVRSQRLEDRGGSTTSYLLALRDVEELVASQERLESQRRQLQATLDSLLDPHLLLEAVRTADGRVEDLLVMDANRAACAFIGLDRERLLGRRLRQLSPAIEGNGQMELYRRCLATGEPLALDRFFYAGHEISGGDCYFDIRMVPHGELLSFTWRDVSERVLAEQQLADSEERYRLLSENASDVVLRLRDGRISWIAASASAVLGAAPEHWLDQPLAGFLAAEDQPLLRQALEKLERGRSMVLRLRMRLGDGQSHWIEASASPYVDGKGRLDGYTAALRVVDEKVRSEQQLQYRASTDDLTRLINRAEILDRLELLLAQRDQRTGRIAVLFVDVDRFKGVNDTYGHAAGDRVLQVIAERLRQTIRLDDLAGRMGGDEFLVVLRRIHGIGEAIAVAEKIRQAVAQPIEGLDAALQATVSIGVTLAQAGETFDDLVARADAAMYAAKRAGRNQVVEIGGRSGSPGSPGGDACSDTGNGHRSASAISPGPAAAEELAPEKAAANPAGDPAANPAAEATAAAAEPRAEATAATAPETAAGQALPDAPAQT